LKETGDKIDHKYRSQTARPREGNEPDERRVKAGGVEVELDSTASDSILSTIKAIFRRYAMTIASTRQVFT
jgi:hypothetical protein